MAVNLGSIDLCLKAVPEAGVLPHVSVSHACYTGNDRDSVNCNLSHDKELFIEAIIVGELSKQGVSSERGLKADRSGEPPQIAFKSKHIPSCSRAVSSFNGVEQRKTSSRPFSI